MTIAPPSPSTNPSRSLSKGRLARFGSSLAVLSAPSRMNEIIPNGCAIESIPPASARRTRPAWMSR